MFTFFFLSGFKLWHNKHKTIFTLPICAGLRNHLTKNILAAHPKALCNDGTKAVFYSSTDEAVSGDVLIYLEVSSSVQRAKL